MDEVQFQKEVFKLRDQEYPYYYQVGLGSGFRVKGVKALMHIRWLTPSFSPSLPPPLLPEQQTTSARPAGPVRHVRRPLQPGLLQLHLLHPLEGARPIMCFARMECGRCLSIVRPINWSSWEDISLVHSRHRWPYLPLHIPSPEIPALTATLPLRHLAPTPPCPHRHPAPTLSLLPPSTGGLPQASYGGAEECLCSGVRPGVTISGVARG